MRASCAGRAHAVFSIADERGPFVDRHVDPSRVVLACDGSAGTGICGEHPSLFAPEIACAAAAVARGADGDQLEERSVAVSVEDSGELVVRLFHLPVVHAGTLCLSRSCGSWKDGAFNEHRAATECDDAGLDDNQSRSVWKLDREEGYAGTGS